MGIVPSDKSLGYDQSSLRDEEGIAEELKTLLERGLAPPRYSEVELRGYLANVRRRTAGVRDDDSDTS